MVRREWESLKSFYRCYPVLAAGFQFLLLVPVGQIRVQRPLSIISHPFQIFAAEWDSNWNSIEHSTFCVRRVHIHAGTSACSRGLLDYASRTACRPFPAISLPS